jgi:hypothetical protein
MDVEKCVHFLLIFLSLSLSACGWGISPRPLIVLNGWKETTILPSSFRMGGWRTYVATNCSVVVVKDTLPGRHDLSLDGFFVAGMFCE